MRHALLQLRERRLEIAFDLQDDFSDQRIDWQDLRRLIPFDSRARDAPMRILRVREQGGVAAMEKDGEWSPGLWQKIRELGT